MRSFLAALVLAVGFAASAHAAQLIHDWDNSLAVSDTQGPGYNRTIGMVVAPTQTVLVKAAQYVGDNLVERGSWTFSVSTANIGQTWTITAANAASLGSPWSVLQEAAGNMESLWWGAPANAWKIAFVTPGIPTQAPYYPNAFYGAPQDTPFFHPVITDLDRVEFTLEHFSILTSTSVFRIHPRMIGEGGLVPTPEPATALLMLLGGMCHLASRRVRACGARSMP